MRAALTDDEIDVTARWIADQQGADGAIPWFAGGKMDPWDHVESAMALATAGQYDAARTAYRFLARTQDARGSWPSCSTGGTVLDPTRDGNQAAYLASGLWHLQRARADLDFLAEMWPTLDSAMRFVLSLVDEDSGAVFWASDENGAIWPAPQITGASSVYGSLVCAERIAGVLGHDRPDWRRTRRRLGRALHDGHPIFVEAKLPTPVGFHAMDWYYPVLGGAIRGEAGRRRLLSGWEDWVDEDHGCRCVTGRPWYTVAETCELVLALDAVGLGERAASLFRWTASLRDDDGGYWTGMGYVDGRPIRWPEERPTWTAASVLLAADALRGDSPTSTFFRDLAPGRGFADPRVRGS